MMTLLGSRIRMLLWRDSENGQALVEYSLILCLVVVVVIVTLIMLGNQVKNTYCNITGGLGA
jgi:Flp pilus assembly pilin Flp